MYGKISCHILFLTLNRKLCRAWLLLLPSILFTFIKSLQIFSSMAVSTFSTSKINYIERSTLIPVTYIEKIGSILIEILFVVVFHQYLINRRNDRS